MRKDFANEVAKTQHNKRADLVEKDIILHQVLIDLSKNKFFSENFVFKGGTCLIKHYLGYYRFSEDIDFTWKNQTIFEDKSQKENRRHLSKIIDEIGKLFEEISAKRGLEFKCEKHNKKFVELGGGNKFCTFKIWYRSEVLNRESFMKVQINFVEKIIFAPQKAELKSLLSKYDEELSLLFPEYQEYMQKIPFQVYDIREILTEKIRSILTRQGIKARDFLDVYLISKKHQIEPEDMYDPIVSKTQFMLDLYKKYRKNLEAKKDLVKSQPFRWGEEKGLLLQPIDEKEFFKFLEDLKPFLNRIVEKVMG
ncbi:MAG: nucleotidyl transferase AbiEii/AbiGii toxin family protein [bacterium]